MVGVAGHIHVQRLVWSGHSYASRIRVVSDFRRNGLHSKTGKAKQDRIAAHDLRRGA